MQTVNHGLQIHEYGGGGYKPLVDFESWRVAMLNGGGEYRAEKIMTVQQHNETDEVFVLLAGRCVLFVAGYGDDPEDAHGELLQPYKVYNVPKGCWHTHALDDEARVLIVENVDTTFENSPHHKLSDEMKIKIVEIANKYLS